MTEQVQDVTNELNTPPGRGTAQLGLLMALGAQTMILELSIPRMIAPAFGNTLFTWTAIIAVVMLALTVGYHFGGRFAGGHKARKWVLIFSSISAAWVLGLSFTGHHVIDQLSFLNLMFGPLAAAFLFATVPTILNAAVVPLTIQTRPEGPGEASGKCFAWSTVGSIIGVLATGYLLLPQLGISGSLIIGAVLVFVALAFNRAWRVGAGGLGIALALALVPQQSTDATIFDYSNGYHRIRVIQTGGVSPARYLYLDNTLEGAVRLGSSDSPLLYQSEFRHIAEALKKPERILVIGGGAFTLPRQLKAQFPQATVDVAELDPDVIETAVRFLELDDSVRVLVGDGRSTLKHLSEKYDLVINDAFRGVRNIPFHMTTVEFNRLVRKQLTEDGVYAINVRGHTRKSHLVNSISLTLKEAFPHATSIRASSGLEPNIWLLASQRPVPVGQALFVDPALAHLLSDNHAPVEYLIVRDLIDRKLESFRAEEN